jgi:NTP pyrophosphatase (non-canonical NTP hydrolase)
MNFDEYQKEALVTAPRVKKTYAVPEDVQEALRSYFGDADGADYVALEPLLSRFDQAVWSLGLAGEAGEFADMMKKYLGHGHKLDREAAAKELGDVLWYIAVLANSIGYNLDSIAQLNIKKLRERYAKGFTILESLSNKKG